ncbi:anti-sigma factor antagonist [Streptomyces sp. Ru73]|uniref:STAS domain-containing protein n=1 Tax=Streptomyces sp. Ru73 TaxID=2080748 RepID=UPI000CDD35D6|nr:STAS domain-containing protein [Streptomyces sp. Ru73]POX38724.1 anti-sigma factor antagonist [Streptomyces sp. Ru73]
MSTGTGRLSVTVLTETADCAVLRVSGELDHASEAAFLADTGVVLADGCRYLVLDVAALTFCDSRGLNCLLALHWLLRRREGTLLLACAGRRLSDLLVHTGSAQLFPLHPTVSKALAALPEHCRPVWPPVTTP